MLKTVLLAGASILAFSATLADAATYLTPGTYGFTAPSAGVYTIHVLAGAGGSFAYTYGGTTNTYTGGGGGFATGDFTLTMNEILTVTVGGKGSAGSYTSGVSGSMVSATYGGDSFVTSGAATLVKGYGGGPAYQYGGGYSNGYGYVASTHNGHAVTAGSYGYGNNTGAGTVEITEISTTPVPEPSTWALMFGGFGLIGYMLRRRFLRTA